MPSALVRRIDLDSIYPGLLAPFLAVLAACEKRGAVYFATYGFRSYAQSDVLYAQGRTTMNPEGPKPGHPLGIPVTNAKGGQSAHNFGLALDVTHEDDLNDQQLRKPDWNPANYAIYREELLKAGLVSGGDFTSKDWPHGQLAGYVTGTQLAVLDAVYRKAVGDDAAKLKAVWAFLDAQPLTTLAAGPDDGEPLACGDCNPSLQSCDLYESVSPGAVA